MSVHGQYTRCDLVAIMKVVEQPAVHRRRKRLYGGKINDQTPKGDTGADNQDFSLPATERKGLSFFNVVELLNQFVAVLEVAQILGQKQIIVGCSVAVRLR